MFFMYACVIITEKLKSKFADVNQLKFIKMALQKKIEGNDPKVIAIPETDDRLNQRQVAQLFGRTEQTIITWKKQGKIPYFQLGRFPIFSKSQLTSIASKNQHLINV